MAKRFDHGRGPSQRQLKVGEEVRRALAEALTRGDLREPALMDASITVSEVRMSADLRHALAFVMPLGGARAAETLAALGRARGELRRAVNRAVSLKFSPELDFRLDDTYDRMEQTRRMLADERVRRDLDRAD